MVRWDDKHRDRGFAKDTFTHTAQKELMHSSVSVRTDDDHGGLMSDCFFQDGLGYWAFQQQRGYGPAICLKRFSELLELIPFFTETACGRITRMLMGLTVAHKDVYSHGVTYAADVRAVPHEVWLWFCDMD
jgi:hypothetical protein